MFERDENGLEFNAEQGGAEFDRLLRSSLESYADPGPDSGLAERVLARIAAEGGGGQTRSLRLWAVALPVAACLIVAIVLLASKPLHRSADRSGEARVTLPKSSNAGRSADKGAPVENSPSVTARENATTRAPRHSTHAAATSTQVRLPKLDVFPAPQPLTPAETEFVAFIAHAPLAERKSLVEAQTQLDAPLTIAALEIKPLEPPEPVGN